MCANGFIDERRKDSMKWLSVCCVFRDCTGNSCACELPLSLLRLRTTKSQKWLSHSCNLLCGLGCAATLSALYTIQGDGVRHNRSSACAGADDSWLPDGARSFLFRLGGGLELNLRLILIAVFGAVGPLARYGLQGFVQVRAGGTFPYGTLLINLSGCFLLGLIGQLTLSRLMISADWRMAIAV